MPQTLTASFAESTRTADLLLRVGPGRLAHIEYMRTATNDLVHRMMIYRGLIMKQHPGETISQHITLVFLATRAGHGGGRGGRVSHGPPDLAGG